MVSPSLLSGARGWEKDPVPLTGKASSQEKTPNMTLTSLKETEERRKWVTLGWKQP